TKTTSAPPFTSGSRAVGCTWNVIQPSVPVCCSATFPIRPYGSPIMQTSAPRTTKPRVSVTRKRAVNGSRDRTTLGANSTPETISRCGWSTLVTGIDTFPSASLIWPLGPGGGGFAAGRTMPDGRDTAELEPALFVAVTRTRIRWPASAEARTYVCDVAPDTSAQLPPPLPQRRHRYENVSGFVPAQLPFLAVSM